MIDIRLPWRLQQHSPHTLCICRDFCDSWTFQGVIFFFFLTRGLKVFIRGCPGFRHPQQRFLHDLDVGEGTVALGILVGTLTDALVVMANILPLPVAHDVAQSRLDEFLLQVIGEDDLKTWKGTEIRPDQLKADSALLDAAFQKRANENGVVPFCSGSHDCTAVYSTLIKWLKGQWNGSLPHRDYFFIYIYLFKAELESSSSVACCVSLDVTSCLTVIGDRSLSTIQQFCLSDQRPSQTLFTIFCCYDFRGRIWVYYLAVQSGPRRSRDRVFIIFGANPYFTLRIWSFGRKQ